MTKIARIKQVAFPFFKKDKHHFLSEKWWFRLLTVLYVIGIVILLFRIWDSLSYSAWGWCYDTSYVYFDEPSMFKQHLDECGQFLRSSRLEVIGGGIAITIFIHYLIQFIFYKVIINFIVLGTKNNNVK